MNYDDYLASDEWKKRKNAKLRKAQWHGRYVLCRGCSCFVLFSHGDIHVHHLTYARIGRERDSDLVVLCRGCHNFIHGIDPPLWWTEARMAGKFACLGKRALREVMLEILATGEVDPDRVFDMAVGVLAQKIGPVYDRGRHRSRDRGGEIDRLKF